MQSLRVFFFLSSLIFPITGKACTLAVSNIDFRDYTSNQTNNLDSTGTITISSCLDVGYKIKLSPGSSGDTNNRTLKSGSTSLNYNLYKDSSRVTKWGNSNTDGYSGLIAACGFLSFSPCQFTIYGRIPGNQNIPDGTYTDNITVTFEY